MEKIQRSGLRKRRHLAWKCGESEFYFKRNYSVFCATRYEMTSYFEYFYSSKVSKLSLLLSPKNLKSRSWIRKFLRFGLLFSYFWLRSVWYLAIPTKIFRMRWPGCYYMAKFVQLALLKTSSLYIFFVNCAVLNTFFFGCKH